VVLGVGALVGRSGLPGAEALLLRPGEGMMRALAPAIHVAPPHEVESQAEGALAVVRHWDRLTGRGRSPNASSEVSPWSNLGSG
jgi:hypothetical protein